MRVILAAVLGGIVMFAWGAFSHMVLNIENGVFRPMPNESTVSAAMNASITADGVYFMPGIDMTSKPSEAEQEAWAAKAKAGPTAFVVYHQTGEDVFTPKQFATQFGVEIDCALIAAFVVGVALVGFCRALVFVDG